MSGTQLEAQTAEARALLADLAALGVNVDEETVELTVASETTLMEAVAAALVEARLDEAQASASNELSAALCDRRDRRLARAARIRDRVAQALGSLGLRKLSTPAGTVSVVAAPARVIVTDESDIPDSWYHEKVVRTLDKAGIRKALLEGVRIGGVELSNRQDTIRVRV